MVRPRHSLYSAGIVKVDEAWVKFFLREPLCPSWLSILGNFYALSFKYFFRHLVHGTYPSRIASRAATLRR